MVTSPPGIGGCRLPDEPSAERATQRARRLRAEINLNQAEAEKRRCRPLVLDVLLQTVELSLLSLGQQVLEPIAERVLRRLDLAPHSTDRNDDAADHRRVRRCRSEQPGQFLFLLGQRATKRINGLGAGPEQCGQATGLCIVQGEIRFDDLDPRIGRRRLLRDARAVVPLRRRQSGCGAHE